MIVDTTVFIDWERKHPSETKPWEDRGPVFLSTITAAELLLGIQHANTPKRKAKRRAFVEAILANFSCLPFTLEAARINAEIKSHLIRKGGIIGAHDLLIAATAISHGFSVLTANADEFKRVPGLEVFSLK